MSLWQQSILSLLAYLIYLNLSRHAADTSNPRTWRGCSRITAASTGSTVEIPFLLNFCVKKLLFSIPPGAPGLVDSRVFFSVFSGQQGDVPTVCPEQVFTPPAPPIPRIWFIDDNSLPCAIVMGLAAFFFF